MIGSFRPSSVAVCPLPVSADELELAPLHADRTATRRLVLRLSCPGSGRMGPIGFLVCRIIGKSLSCLRHLLILLHLTQGCRLVEFLRVCYRPLLCELCLGCHVGHLRYGTNSTVRLTALTSIKERSLTRHTKPRRGIFTWG